MHNLYLAFFHTKPEIPPFLKNASTRRVFESFFARPHERKCETMETRTIPSFTEDIYLRRGNALVPSCWMVYDSTVSQKQWGP